VQTVISKAGATTSNGMLGYMFWAAEKSGTRSVSTAPPNSCENGMGGAMSYYSIPAAMPPLRQQ
jgi:hypothetical protein